MTMGYTYEAMDKEDKTIMKYFENASRYMDVFQIIDKKGYKYKCLIYKIPPGDR